MHPRHRAEVLGTQIYRREDGTWKVAHRHGSVPPEQLVGGTRIRHRRVCV